MGFFVAATEDPLDLFLAGFLGFFAAAFRLSGNAHPSQGASENGQQFDGLHIGPIDSVCLARLSLGYELFPTLPGAKSVRLS